MNTQYDLIVVGAGVLGTFHAYHALQKGLKVLLIEKDKAPQSATTRNFGQVVPSGMNGKWQAYGRQSLEIYKTIQSNFDITVRQHGSIYIASNDEEQQLIEELHAINLSRDYQSELFTKGECLRRYPGLRNDYVMSGLFFPQEVTVEPREMIHRLIDFLQYEYKLDYCNYTQVVNATASGLVTVKTAGGNVWKASKLVICNGSDCKTLFPGLFRESDLEVTKLQMLQTVPQPHYYLPGSVLTGLSIRRYEAFHECASWKSIKKREDANTLANQWGVHILFKQAADGSVIIGDSHEYADIGNIDDLGYHLNEEINAFMIAEAKKIIALPDYSIQRKWYGMYTQCKQQDVFQATVEDHIHIVTGIGGKGMTGSAGFAKENIDRLFNKD